MKIDNYIERSITGAIKKAIPFYPVIVITGPRQVGKTTLCRHLFEDFRYVNLERPTEKHFALDDIEGFVDGLGPKAIIDEVQNAPEILSYIQIKVDENPDLKYVITGSSNFSLLHNITQSLAGRAALFTLLPLSFKEINDYVQSSGIREIMYNGFYPAIFTKEIPPEMFYSNYYSTYVERDIRQISQLKNLNTFEVFMRLCAGRTGSELNYSSLGVETGVSAPTIKEWLSLLNASYITFTLHPFFTNINKRLTKSPKLYFFDTGLLCFLLGIENPNQLMTHPLRGAIFENLVVTEIMKEKYNSGKIPKIFFYRENSGREVDIVEENGLNLNLYEVKASKTFSKDFRKNLEYLKKNLSDFTIKKSVVVYDGDTFPTFAVNVRDLWKYNEEENRAN
ncbi:MAG: ATP-binding protein [Muribaculaceae bacterium]|nr:ATP-binding protein [Muribaculaceae bacterium]